MLRIYAWRDQCCTSLFFGLFTFLLAITGCAPTPILYTPPVQHVPMLHEQDECELRFSSGNRGYTLQGAYAISDNCGLLVDSRRIAYEQEEKDWDGEVSSRRHREQTMLAGVGSFGALGERKKARWGFYGGGGRGLAGDTPLKGTLYSKADAHYWQFFLQPQIGFATRIAEGALSLRSSYTFINKVRAVDPRYHGKRFEFFTLEPALTLGLGYDPVKIFAQVGLTLGGKEFTKTIDPVSGPVNMTVGLKVEIR